MNVGQLVATFDIDASGAEAGEARSELALANLQRSADGRLRDLRGRFASESQLMGEALASGVQVGTDAVAEHAHTAGEAVGEGLGQGAEDGARRTLASMSDAELAVAGFTRSADGRIRDLRGRFISESTSIGDALARGIGDAGERASERLSQGVGRASRDLQHGGDDGRRFGGALSAIGDAAGPIGSVVGRLSMVAGAVGGAIPLVAGLAATLVNIAPAAGIAATGLLAVASAGAAIKIGTSGIGSAIKAAFADAPAAAGGAAGAANQVANAQRAVKDAVQSAADANARAVRQVADAERNLTDAQKAAKGAQDALTDARKQAAQDLEDLNDRLADSALGQRSAVLRVKTAQEELNKTMADTSATEQQKQEAQLAFDEATQHLKEQGTQVTRLKAQVAEANAAGVEGSQKVVTAQERVTLAQRTVGDQTRAVQDAQTQQSRTAEQGAEQVARAIEALGQAGAGAAGGGVDPLAAALAKLTPNARAFVQEVIALKPALADLKFDVQQQLFDGMAASFRTAAASVLPVLHEKLVGAAGAMNAMGRGAIDAAGHLGSSGILGQAMDAANKGLMNMSGAPAVLVTGFGQIAAAAGPAFERITAASGGAFERLGATMSTAFASGGMERAISAAVDLIGQLAEVLGNVGQIVGSVFGAANANGATYVQTLIKITDALVTAFASPAVQAGLSALFSTMSLLASTVAPLLGQALGVIGPVLAALGPPVQTLITALGSALSPIIAALGPVLLAAAQAVGQLIVAASPLLGLIGTLASALLPALTPLLVGAGEIFGQMAPLVAAVADALSALLGPILAQLPALVEPFVTILTTLTSTLLPVLTQLIQQLPLAQLGQSFADVAIALTPLLAQFAVLIGQGLQALMPLLMPIIATVSKLAAIFAGELARTVQQIVVPALTGLTQLLSGDVDGAVSNAGKVLSGMAQMVVREFILLPGQVMLALWDLGNSLWDAGLSITDSLVRGIKSGLGKVRDTLSGLTDMIPNWKGPADRDGRLLTPAGQLIMDGLMVGIGDRVPALRGQLQGLTAEIGGMGMGRLGSPQLAMAGAGAGGGFGGVSIENYHAGGQSIEQISEDILWKSKGRG